jgi:outer membrane protein, heavy metal efflux system
VRRVIRAIATSLALILMGRLSSAAPESSPKAPVLLLLRDDTALNTWLLARSHQVGAASARVGQASADLDASRQLAPNPSVDFGVGDIVLGPTNPEGLHFRDTAIYSIGISQTIELGKRGPRADAARLRLDASRQDYRGTLAGRVTDVRYALGRLVYFQARQTQLEESLRSAVRGLDLEQRRLDLQDLSGNDFDRLVLDTMTLEADVAKNQAELGVAAADCRALLTAPCDLSPAGITELDGAAALPAGANAKTALTTRPDLESLRLQGEAALADSVLARRRVIPDPTVRVGYTHDNLTISGDQADTLGVTLALPLPIFDHGQYDAARATARTREIQFEHDALTTEAQASADGLWQKRALLEATLAKLTSQALPKSLQIVESTNKAFDQGQLSLTDLLLARRTHIGLVLAVMELRFDLFTVRNDLRRVLGLDANLPEATR